MLKELSRAEAEKAVELENISEITTLVENGLVAVALCVEGWGRSVSAMHCLTIDGYPAVYIVGGLNEISSLPEHELENFATALASVPYVFATIEPEENRKFRKIIEKIDEARISQGKLPTFIQSHIEATPRMLRQYGIPRRLA